MQQNSSAILLRGATRRALVLLDLVGNQLRDAPNPEELAGSGQRNLSAPPSTPRPPDRETTTRRVRSGPGDARRRRLQPGRRDRQNGGHARRKGGIQSGDRDDLLAALRGRDKISSSAIGHAIAVPICAGLFLRPQRPRNPRRRREPRGRGRGLVLVAPCSATPTRQPPSGAPRGQIRLSHDGSRRPPGDHRRLSGSAELNYCRRCSPPHPATTLCPAH